MPAADETGPRAVGAALAYAHISVSLQFVSLISQILLTHPLRRILAIRLWSMDVLGALGMNFFAHTRAKYQDTEWKFDSTEDASLDGRVNRLSTDTQEGVTHLEARRGDRDRTAWGSYTETAPPVLPTNTWIPGFEDELLFLERRNRDEVDNDGFGDGDSEDEQAQLRDGNIEDERGNEVTKSLGDAFNAPTRRTRDFRLPFSAESSVIVSTLSFLPTILSNLSYHHGNPSSLFGSTTRPALHDLARSSERGVTSRGNSRSSTMASKSHLWISLWFLLSAPVIFWDVSYCFMRPRSFKGGDLHWIWKPYEIYQEVDLVYGVEAYNRGDGFASAQSFLNVIETLLNLCYLYAQHILATPVAPLIGFAAAAMTLSKTVLYWAQEFFCGGCAVGHNDLWTLFWLWILPNGLWLVVPSLIIARLSRDIAGGLTSARKIGASKKD